MFVHEQSSFTAPPTPRLKQGRARNIPLPNLTSSGIPVEIHPWLGAAFTIDWHITDPPSLSRLDERIAADESWRSQVATRLPVEVLDIRCAIWERSVVTVWASAHPFVTISDVLDAIYNARRERRLADAAGPERTADALGLWAAQSGAGSHGADGGELGHGAAARYDGHNVVGGRGRRRAPFKWRWAHLMPSRMETNVWDLSLE